jgi:hypothetical protein
MGLREVFRERRLMLILAAVMAFFLVSGIVFRLPEDPGNSSGAQPREPTLQELGLDDPGLRTNEARLPGVLEEWRSQSLIGH